jgi:PIN domain nuclease of toxin-antitoxin system
MMVAVADTHAAIWYVFGDPRLSANARALFERARDKGDQVGVCSITFAEIVYLVEKGRVAPDTFARLAGLLDDPARELREIPFARPIAAMLSAFARRQVPDLPDRIIAATAHYLGVPVISRDRRIRASGITTIW